MKLASMQNKGYVGEPCVTLAELAKMLQVAELTVSRRVSKGLIPKPTLRTGRNGKMYWPLRVANKLKVQYGTKNV